MLRMSFSVKVPLRAVLIISAAFALLILLNSISIPNFSEVAVAVVAVAVSAVLVSVSVVVIIIIFLFLSCRSRLF